MIYNNMTVYTEQRKNVQRTWFLMTIFLVLIVAVGWGLSQYYASPDILYVAVVLSLVMNISSYWFSDKIVLRLANARVAVRVEQPELFRLVENLAITAGLPMPKVYIIEDVAPNAFATGRDKDHAVVAVTTGLLALLNKNELEGVIAHELSHIGNRDILLGTVVVVLVGLLSIVADWTLRGSMHRGGNNKNGGVLAVVGLVLIILSPLIAKLIQLAISRKREFLADASGVLLTRYPEGLAQALQKIESAHLPVANAHAATAHLYISNPFGPGKHLANLFSTHPPTSERVRAIMGER